MTDLKTGDASLIVVEPSLSTSKDVKIQWTKSDIDQGELARLRLVEGWSYRKLRKHFRAGQPTLKRLLKPFYQPQVDLVAENASIPSPNEKGESNDTH